MWLLAESYLHRLDPFAIEIGDGYGVRWYGLSYLAGFVIAWLFLRWMGRSRRSPLKAESAGDLIFWVIVGVIVGGRVGYAVFYEPHLLIGFSGSFPFWDLLRLSGGGMASHGGMIGVIVVCTLFARKHALPVTHLFDLGALACTGGLFLGRLANFVNGELWGRALPPSMRADPPAWSIQYPEEVLAWAADPDAYPEAFAALDQCRPFVTGGERNYLVEVIEACKNGQAEVLELIRPHLTPFYPSQIFQALAEGPVLAAILAIVWWGPRKPGVVGAWFLLAYGILRVATEQFRQPDEGVALLFGLSRGQTLSVVMIASGLVLLAYFVRRPARKLGGLVRFTPHVDASPPPAD